VGRVIPVPVSAKEKQAMRDVLARG